MPDFYRSYHHLLRNETEGVAFRKVIRSTGSRRIVVAPHGGKIEPGTAEVAEAIAGTQLTYYAFIGLRSRATQLHLSSTRMDDAELLDLVEAAESVLTVHGRAGDDVPLALVGGCDVRTADEIRVSLVASGFAAIMAGNAYQHLAGTHPHNICNMGRSRKGVQLELTRLLRTQLADSEETMTRFIEAVRRVWAA